MLNSILVLAFLHVYTVGQVNTEDLVAIANVCAFREKFFHALKVLEIPVNFSLVRQHSYVFVP